MNKTVLITGSTRGIGYATALEFLHYDYNVVFCGMKKTDFSKEIVRGIITKYPSSSFFYFDVSKPDDVRKNCKLILDKFKAIDILVNNAGIVKDSTLMKMSNEDWDIVIKTNLYGTFFVTKEILPTMIENKFGRIINLSSIIGQVGGFGQSNYSASKAGIIGLTKSLAKETAKKNVTVNAICPGFTDTDMVKNVPPEVIEKIISSKIAVGRLARPEEVAKLIFFLASEDAGYITGECFSINGGWL